MSTVPSKIVQERNLKTLLELVSQPGNDICADCKARSPRWASHSLGIFLCVNCASIHRKIGTHVTKVKSVTMDAWTKEQVERMKEMGNLNSNAIFNPNESRFPPPPGTVDPDRDSELELYIRDKYEFKRFFDRGALVASKLGPSRSAGSVKRESPSPAPPVRQAPSPAFPPSKSPSIPPTAGTSAAPQPVTAPPRVSSQNVQLNPPASGVWNDLVSLQSGPPSSGTLPLQVLSPEAQAQAQAMGLTGQAQLPQPTGMPMGVGLSVPGVQMAPMQTGFPTMGNGMTPSYFQAPQPQMMTGMMAPNIQQPMMTTMVHPTGMMMMQQPQAAYPSSPAMTMQPTFYGTPSPQPQFINPGQGSQQYGTPAMQFQQPMVPQMQVPQMQVQQQPQQAGFTSWMSQQGPQPGTWGSL